MNSTPLLDKAGLGQQMEVCQGKTCQEFEAFEFGRCCEMGFKCESIVKCDLGIPTDYQDRTAIYLLGHAFH